MSKRLIVNADDYGHTRGVSQGIRLAHLRGIVTSTTAMMNYPGAVDDLRMAVKECPRLGLGLHLVLTSGRPVLPAEKVPDLVNLEGKFYKYGPFIERMNQINLLRSTWSGTHRWKLLRKQSDVCQTIWILTITARTSPPPCLS
ncbi:MAG: ChbG/HpnK family deacetylase [Anaerolineae bacterium]|nr:ChbG/HpnK family deacetylase [Anaerolineae bacterium]